MGKTYNEQRILNQTGTEGFMNGGTLHYIQICLQPSSLASLRV